MQADGQAAQLFWRGWFLLGIAAHHDRGAGLGVGDGVGFFQALGEDVHAGDDGVEAAGVEAEDQVGEGNVAEARLQAQTLGQGCGNFRVEAFHLVAFVILERWVGNFHAHLQLAAGEGLGCFGGVGGGEQTGEGAGQSQGGAA